MLKDAQNAVDDLGTICKAVMMPGQPFVPCSDHTRQFIARNVATEILKSLTPAVMRGVDVGAEVAALLREQAKRNGVDVSEPVPHSLESFHDTPVRQFHEAFGHPVNYNPFNTPPIEDRVLRIRMLAEELLETARAMGVSLACATGLERANDGVSVVPRPEWTYDPIEAADGLADLRYVVDGGNLICGFPGERVLAEVHRSNMSKLGADGQPVRRADGKILKGPGYFKPDIAHVLGMDLALEKAA